MQNIRRATELINGTVVMPGEEFSVEQATLPYTEENGYVAGSAYENGQIVESIGGGLCQVSTTLYNAVLYAELEVTRRAPHSMSVSYVEPSRDAMIAEGISDFKFVNNYDTPILIEGYIDGNNQLGFIFTEKIPELQDIPWNLKVRLWRQQSIRKVCRRYGKCDRLTGNRGSRNGWKHGTALESYL